MTNVSHQYTVACGNNACTCTYCELMLIWASADMSLWSCSESVHVLVLVQKDWNCCSPPRKIWNGHPVTLFYLFQQNDHCWSRCHRPPRAEMSLWRGGKQCSALVALKIRTIWWVGPSLQFLRIWKKNDSSNLLFTNKNCLIGIFQLWAITGPSNLAQRPNPKTVFLAGRKSWKKGVLQWKRESIRLISSLTKILDPHCRTAAMEFWRRTDVWKSIHFATIDLFWPTCTCCIVVIVVIGEEPPPPIPV